MTLVVTHNFTSAKANTNDATRVGSTRWNENHVLTGTVDASQLNANVVQAVVNDTNVTGAIAAQTMTLGWTGQLGLTRGGTNADLSATGGAANYLKQAGVGSAVTVGTIPASDIASGAAITKVDDTNVTLTLGGTPATAALKATSLTLGWTGTLAVTRGGTGVGSAVLGDLLYGSAANTLSALAGNTTSTRKFLRQTGTGTVSAAPVWDTLLAADVGSSAALTKADDTNVTLTLGGAPTTALLTATSITAGWTGTLSVTRGGTGANLSATGGTSQVLKQTSVGGAVTVAQLAASDLSNGTTGSGAVVLAGTPTLTGTPILAAPSATTLIVGSSATLPSGGTVVLTSNATTLPASSALLHLGGATGSGPNMFLDAFGTNPSVSYRRANTSAASPSALAANDTILQFGGLGYGTTGYASGNRAIIRGNTAEIWSDTAQGTYFVFLTTPPTTAVAAEAIRIQGSGGLSVGTTTDPGIGALLTNTSIKSQSATAGIGYATGAGGTISQGTNRTTGVTLNTVTGAITLFSQVNTAVSGATAQSFTLTNSAIAAADVVHVTQKTGTDKYLIFVTATAAGSCQITNYTTGGTTNEAPVFSFAVIKGVTS